MFGEKALKLNKSFLVSAGIVLYFGLAIIMILSVIVSNNQSENPLTPRITFVGKYKISNGEWRPIIQGEHIPADKGDVTLDGYFRMDELETADPKKQIPFDTSVSLYMNHISVKIYEPNSEYPVIFECENEYLGENSCGQLWVGYTKSYDFTENVQIVIHNPHSFGNATAVDDFLDSMYVYATPHFDKMALGFGTVDRAVGVVGIISAFIILGVALFSTLLRTKYVREFAFMGFLIFFGGVYFIFGADGVFFWNDTVIVNTLIKGISSMLYMLFAYFIVVDFLKGKMKSIGAIATALSGITGIVCIGISLITDVYFYDTLMYWALVSGFSAVVLLGCLVKSFSGGKMEKAVNVISGLIVLSFVVDIISTAIGIWQGGFVSKNAFIIAFALGIAVVMQTIPKNINAVVKARELEAEKATLNAQLAETRISTMMSQIRPHFIYNTLGSIEQLCELDPKKAGELVHNFAKYLRGNFGELDNPKPISVSREMEHVKYYVSIENVRFPDMTFTFEQTAGDFEIPALTIQPVVENSIKHGLLKLSKGGSVYIKTYETDTHYCVSVVDDGVGFDPTILQDPRKHVGMRNIRERLEIMVGGTMEVESVIGEGTKTLIKIPKKQD